MIIDFGGFRGRGTSEAALGFEELTVVTHERDMVVCAYIKATKKEIQALPHYEAVK